jgi:hypothetical protein
MALESLPLTADQWKQQIQAEQRLATMDVLEDMAILAEEEDCESIRQRMANRYRKLIGVLPEHRQAFQSELERIKEDGGQWPDDLADRIEREHQEKGSAGGRDSLVLSS